jgi:urease accessory protein
MGWDVTAFGLPLAQQPFEKGQFLQHIEVPGVWLERGLIRAEDHRLMNSPLGLAGQRCMASLFFVAGSKLERNRRAQALDVAREVIEKHELRLSAGATSPDGQVVIVRVLAPVVEPAMHLLRQVWMSWRQHFWGMPSTPPRIWST